MQHKAHKQPRKPSIQVPAWAIARYRHQQAILAAFERLEQARQTLHEANRELMELIGQDPKEHERWQAFLAAGGLTFDELRCWVQGRQIRPVKQHGQLRLIEGLPL